MRVLNLVVLVLLAFTAQAALAQEQTLRFYGYAYDLASNKFIYAERHEQQVRDDQWVGGSITYFDADGREMGRKALDFSRDLYVPIYQLDLSGYREGIREQGGRWLMYRQAGKEPEQTKAFEKRAATAADSGFHSIIRANLAKILAGEALRFRMAAAGHLDSFKFVVTRKADAVFEGKPAVLLEAGADSLLSLLSAPLLLTYEPKTGRLLEYRGISNVHDARTGEPYNARISYYSTPPADAPKLPALK